MLQHILNCDVERTKLLQEADDLAHTPDDELTEEQTKEKARRLVQIATRLETIESAKAESKAT